jgi:hypothetical protein
MLTPITIRDTIDILQQLQILRNISTEIVDSWPASLHQLLGWQNKQKDPCRRKLQCTSKLHMARSIHVVSGQSDAGRDCPAIQPRGLQRCWRNVVVPRMGMAAVPWRHRKFSLELLTRTDKSLDAFHRDSIARADLGGNVRNQPPVLSLGQPCYQR